MLFPLKHDDVRVIFESENFDLKQEVRTQLGADLLACFVELQGSFEKTALPLSSRVWDNVLFRYDDMANNSFKI